MLHGHRSLPQVGAQDPELRNSPIADEEDEETDVVPRRIVASATGPPGAAACWYNGAQYDHGTYVVSGSQVLRCHYGVWMDSGSADERNP